MPDRVDLKANIVPPQSSTGSSESSNGSSAGYDNNPPFKAPQKTLHADQ